jgi:predicted MPP superfamily phosphohydrolase
VAHLFVPFVVGLTALVCAMLSVGALRLARAWRGLSSSRWTAVAAVAFGVLLVPAGVYAALVEPRSLVVNELSVASAFWHGAPLRIAAISDTHVGGPHVDSARVVGIVDEINTLQPDLVVLLGDYGAGHVPEARCDPSRRKEIQSGLAAFGALRARYGVIAVLGNHDSWYGRRSITSALQRVGIAVLWNGNVVIHREHESDVVVAGIADEMTGDPDFAVALEGVPAGADTLVLSHSPEPFAYMPEGPALMLAGHTHCGQVTVPFVGRPVLPIAHEEYGCHLVQKRGKTLFVTAGIGTTFFPVRFLNPPEITVVTLRSAASP